MAKATKPTDDETTALEASETAADSVGVTSDEEEIVKGELIDEKSDLDAEVIPENSKPPEPSEEEVSDPLDTSEQEPLETEPLEHLDEPPLDAVEDVLPPASSPVQQKSSIWPAVFGGVVAAMLGFVAGRGDQFDAYLPESMQRKEADLAPLIAQATALDSRVDTLETAVPKALDPSKFVSIDALQSATAEIDSLKVALSDLTQRIETVERQPAKTVVQQPAENTEDIDSLQAAVKVLQDQVSADEARAKSEAERILAQAALTRVMTAIDSGEAFASALGALEDVTPVDVPGALKAAAGEGVASMAVLRENFPEAARAGLSAARAEVPETDVTSIGGFLRRQLSVRSVTPREGDDPDAILSRVEAAIKAGNLDEAMTEIDALPDTAKTAMQGWIDDAAARQTVHNAARELADSLTVN